MGLAQAWAARALLLLVAAVPVAHAGVEAVDDRGVTVTLPAPARRIVTLAPNLTELAYAAGAGGKIVGASRFSDYPPEAKALPVVGDAARIDFERLLELRPDLVLAWKSGNRAADLQRIAELGISVFALELTRLADVARAIRTIGRLAGTVPVAHAVAAEFENGLAALEGRYHSRPEVRVFYQIWRDPLITVNGTHLISDVLKVCGGENVFSREPELTPVVSLESVLAADPQAIIASTSSRQEREEVLRLWRRFPRLQAVARGHVFFVDPALIERQGPRVLAGVQAVCADLEKTRKR